LIIKNDNERNEELINMKKAWETFQAGRAEKAMQTRQKFLDSLQLTPEINDTTMNFSEAHADTEISSTSISSVIEQQVVKQTSSRKKSPLKKGSPKQMDLIPPQLQIDEPFFDEPPPSIKSKISLPPLDLQPFIKYFNSIIIRRKKTYSYLFRRKSSLNESILFESLTEEQFEHRRKSFDEYLKSLNVIRQYQEDDHNHRSNEKTRQLEEYVDLQARIDQIRRCINEPREAFRQRFLEIERQRLQILAAEQQQQQQRLLEEEKAKAAAAAAMVKPIKKKTSAGKKKKK
jgi:hypothetical protein